MVDNIKDIKDKFSGFTPYINGYQNMKRASVLIPIIKRDNSYEILFEVRAKTLRSQPNEIAFPGGKIEKGEDPQTACIRETCEEIGITQDDIEIISPLDLYLNHSNLIIHPFLGIIKESALKNDIENKLDRVRVIRWGPRTIDVDVLFYDDIVSDDEKLLIPHPRIKERAFVLVPLMDLNKELSIDGKTIEAYLNDLSQDERDEVKKFRL